MNVYVLMGEDYDASVLLGVYSSLDAAVTARTAYNADDDNVWWSQGVHIHEVALDSAADLHDQWVGENK